MNFGYVTVYGVNSNEHIHKILQNYENQLNMEYVYSNLKLAKYNNIVKQQCYYIKELKKFAPQEVDMREE